MNSKENVYSSPNSGSPKYNDCSSSRLDKQDLGAIKTMKGEEKQQKEKNSSDLILEAKNKALEKELRDLKKKITDITLELQLALGIPEPGLIAQTPGQGPLTTEHETYKEPDSAPDSAQAGSPQGKSADVPAVSEQERTPLSSTEDNDEPLDFSAYISQIPYVKYHPGKFKRRRTFQILDVIMEVDETEQSESTNINLPAGQFKLQQEIPNKLYSSVPKMPLTQLKVKSPHMHRPSQILYSPTMVWDAKGIEEETDSASVYFRRVLPPSALSQVKIKQDTPGPRKLHTHIPRMPITQLKVKKPNFDRPIYIPKAITENQNLDILQLATSIGINQETPEPEKILPLPDQKDSDFKKPKTPSLWRRFKKLITPAHLRQHKDERHFQEQEIKEGDDETNRIVSSKDEPLPKYLSAQTNITGKKQTQEKSGSTCGCFEKFISWVFK